MTTESTQEIGERLAREMGWRPVSAMGFTFWEDDTGYHHKNPADLGECMALMAEFNVWPRGNSALMWWRQPRSGILVSVEHDNTAADRLDAAIRAALLAISEIVKRKGNAG